MNLSDFISDPSRRKALAAAVSTSPAYLWQIATNRRQASPRLAQAIHQQTMGVISKETLRPDVWGDESTDKAA
ncbi:MAG: helix-turn-helix domain-containing protein [Pseudomonadota bacterium]|nr:helix-turn-helix domain-containing protein [Pseudomonadota bacterium]